MNKHLYAQTLQDEELTEGEDEYIEFKQYSYPFTQEKVDEMSNKDNGSIRLKKSSKKDEDHLKNRRKCCK